MYEKYDSVNLEVNKPELGQLSREQNVVKHGDDFTCKEKHYSTARNLLGG